MNMVNSIADGMACVLANGGRAVRVRLNVTQFRALCAELGGDVSMRLYAPTVPRIHGAELSIVPDADDVT